MEQRVSEKALDMLIGGTEDLVNRNNALSEPMTAVISLALDLRESRFSVASLLTERREAWEALGDLPTDNETLKDGITRALASQEVTLKGLREALAQLPPDDDQYYVCDSRGVTGNCMMFWRKGNAGYTCNLDDCRVWTKAEAFRQHESRETDIPYLKRDVDALAERHLDVQDLRAFECRRDAAAPEVIQ